jgi:hypothetical protein
MMLSLHVLLPEHHHHHPLSLSFARILLAPFGFPNWARRRKEQDLDRDRKGCMKRKYNHKEDFTRLGFCGAENGIQVSQ